ncbi:MAG: hypothetical protein K9L22_11705 [Methylococcaceae bacterium]|nr:hypothetical protein [Methylococcaceae bacterium]
MLRLLKVIMLSMLFSLTACQFMEPRPEQLSVVPQLGESYYTQVTLMYENDVYSTTNYRRGTLLEVNTAVELLEIEPKMIKVKILQSNRELLIKTESLIENIAQYTSDDAYQAFAKLFAQQEVDLSRFNQQERDNIKKGTVAKGMSKAAVKIAIGYPSIVRTPSLDSNKWTYWRSPANSFVVHFENDQVIRIQPKIHGFYEGISSGREYLLTASPYYA